MVLAATAFAAGAGALAYSPLAGRQPRPGYEAPPWEGAWAPGVAEAREEARPRTDRYGDPLPPGAVARLGTVRYRHTDAGPTVACPPDGGRVAPAGWDCACRFWDAATGREVRRIANPSASGGALAYSADGKVIAVEGGRGQIDPCDAATGEVRQRLDSR